MNKEIERKYLIDNKLFIEYIVKNKNEIIDLKEIKQGYINSNNIILKGNSIIINDNKELIININDLNQEDLIKYFFDKKDIYGNNVFNNQNYNIFRIRTSKSKNEAIAFLTLKGKNDGISRIEFEYMIEYDLAIKILKTFCSILIEKTRYEYLYKNKLWEIDVFEEQNEGLIIAEIELEDENELFEKPNFILKDVSLDFRFLNNNLLKNPYNKWKNDV